jgi:tetratricopeptide (TPR) repeat protein
MAEGLIEAVTGEEAEAAKDGAQVAMDPFAAAVIQDLAAQDPAVSDAAKAFLAAHTRLTDSQTAKVHDEHAHFKKEVGLRLFGLWLRTGLQTTVAVIAVVFGLIVMSSLYEAARSQRILVESFESPPSLAATGLSGKVVAAAFLDQLVLLKNATHIVAEKRAVSRFSESELGIELPETGLSLAAIEEYFRRKFGRDEMISGDLVKQEDGALVLSIRGSNVAPKSFIAPAGNFDELTRRAAEYVYGEAEPGLFSHYLVNDGRRYEEAIHFVRAHLNNAEPYDRAMLLNYWANAASELTGYRRENFVPNEEFAISLYREAVTVKPDFWIGYENLVSNLQTLGREEEALQIGKKLKEMAPRFSSENQPRFSAFDELTGAYVDEIAELTSRVNQSGGGETMTGVASQSAAIGFIYAANHDYESARKMFSQLSMSDEDKFDRIAILSSEALIAEAGGDTAGAVRLWDQYLKMHEDPALSAADASYLCLPAIAYELAGQHQKADEMLHRSDKLLGVDTYLLCYVARARILSLRGDWAGAKSWYEKAIQLGPSSPMPYLRYGEDLFARGDIENAQRQAIAANKNGPHFADPLKLWGDTLLKQGNKAIALVKYDEALKYAPAWIQLKQARDSLR